MKYSEFLKKKQLFDCPSGLDVVQNLNKHLFYFQRDVVWSNPGDIVFSPFAGIGSEGYVSLQMGRKFVGSELKKSYFTQACSNLSQAMSNDLFEFGEVVGESLPDEEKAKHAEAIPKKDR